MKKNQVGWGKNDYPVKKIVRIMKLTVLLFFLGLMQMYALNSYAQKTKLSLDLKNTSIESVLMEIENQSSFKFIYNKANINVDAIVNIQMKDKTINEILNALFENEKIDYSFYDRQIILSKAAEINNQVKTLNISGKVTDPLGSPLPGVTVVVKGTTQGTVTDSDGNYSLANIPGNGILVFSFVGMKLQEINIDEKQQINVVLQEETIGIDEVVAIGYGTLSRKRLTTAISKYEPEELSSVPINTIGEGLKGKISGVRVYNLSGQPGETPDIRIRGGSSIQKSNNPLVLIDGFERSMGDVNPNDIESIEVLKDAAATAIYGARSSNGVVLITTKRGIINEDPQITFDANFSYQTKERFYKFMNAEQFLTILRPSLARSPNPNYNTTYAYATSTNNDENSYIGLRFLNPGETPPEGWKTMPDPLDPSKTLTFVDNDWTDIMFNPAFRQLYNLNVSGGNQNLKYSGSVGYTSDGGVVYSTGWKRFNARANTDIKVSDRINVSTDFDFIETHPEAHPDQAKAISRQAIAAPTQRVYMDDGTPARGFNSSSTNPMFWDYVHYRDQVDKSFSIRTALDYKITSNLDLSVSGTHFNANSQDESFERSNAFSTLRPASSNFHETVIDEFEGVLNYARSIKNHNISALAGMTYRGVHNKSLSAAGRGAASDKVMTLNVAPEPTNASSSKSDEVLVGMFGRITYDYLNKYLFSASIRRDGSSRFGTDNKWGIFPSLSAGWNISDEDFLKHNKTISSLKIRTSIGQTGNNAIGLYTAQGSYSLAYRYDGNAGIRNTTMPNRGLTWETTTQWDIGLDIGLFNNNIKIIADLYDKRTRDLLFSVPLPNTSGFSSIETNVGTVRFYGYDFELSTVNIKTNDFSWLTNFTISGNKNVVLELPDNDRDRNRIGGFVVPNGEDFGGIAEGEPLYRIYGHKVDFIIDNEEQAANARWDYWSAGWDEETKTKTKGRKFPGDYEWCDRDGDNQITEYDQFELGREVPHTVGGIGNNLKYKNFTFRVYMDYALGHSFIDFAYRSALHSNFNTNANMPIELLDAWKQPGDAAKTKWARVAAYDTNTSRNYRREVSNMIVFKCDYLCLREVTLDYQLPTSLISRWGIRDINIYVSGNNLHYFTAVLARPPEGAPSSSNQDSYPPIRKITLGLKVTL